MTGSSQQEKSGKCAKKKLLLVITNSFAAMNVIHSGLLKRVSEQYRISIVSTMICHEELAEINLHGAMEIHLLNVRLPAESKILRLLRRLEKVIFSVYFDIETFHIKAANQNPVFRTAARLVKFSPAASRIALRLLRKMIISMSAFLWRHLDLLHVDFDGIISTSPLDIRENAMVNALAGKKIRSLAMIISWDNLTSKGVMNADHDYVLIWNELMVSELKQFNSVFKGREKICVTGVPRFDTYFLDDDTKSPAAFRQGFKISPTNKVIFFATSAWKHFHCQFDIVADLVRYIHDRGGIDLIVRCHPADRPELYRTFEEVANVHIQHCGATDPESDNKFYSWLPDAGFLNSLKDILKNCDVCIQIASTIRLDAAACNKPVISIAYDGQRQLPYHQSVRRLYDYSHQIPLNKSGIDQMAHSREELFEYLDQILNDTTPKNYVNKVLPFIHFDEAKSVDTILKCVEEWLE